MNILKSGDEVLKYFGVQPELGLTKEQVEEAQKKYGPNELPAEEGKSLWALIGKLLSFLDQINLDLKCKKLNQSKDRYFPFRKLLLQVFL